MEYLNPGSPSVKKFKTLMSAKKVMLVIFWDSSGELRQGLYNIKILQATHLQNQTEKECLSFASRQYMTALQCTNTGCHGKNEIRSGSTTSFQPRFDTVGLLVVPKTEGDVVFQRMPKFRQPCANGCAAN
ncbi:hypothetical protein TNCV_1611391 [Trichonephila clavipes]|nr:hypothetical protein TNCV_1611391 [Trichonephila clavipes]